MIRTSRSLKLKCTNKEIPRSCWRAASTHCTGSQNISSFLPDQGSSYSSSAARSTRPTKFRSQYAHYSPSQTGVQRISGSYSKRPVNQHDPILTSGKVDQRSANIGSFQDIYLAPTTRPAKPPHCEDKILVEPRNRFLSQATSTIPYLNLTLRSHPREKPPNPAQHKRCHFSTSTTFLDPITSPSPEPIDIDQYHRFADTYIDNLVTKLEAIQEERDEVDCEYTAGVLTLAFPPVGTYVLNKQPPNRQIWLSSPISGPKRYDYVAINPAETDRDSSGGNGASTGGAGIDGREKRGTWVYLRDGSTLSEVLREELGVDPDDYDV